MPDLVVSNEGERELSRLALKAALVTPRIWHLRLFKNDYTPDRDVTLASLVECDFPGYAALAIDPANWSDAITVGGVAVSFYGTTYTQFAATSGLNLIYGYYVTFENGAKLLYAQRFDHAQTATSTNPAIVWPQLNDHSEYEPAPVP